MTILRSSVIGYIEGGSDGVLSTVTTLTNHARRGAFMAGENVSLGASPDLVGRVFGRLTVISRAVSSPKGSRWLCKCECGSETIVARGNLIKSTRSCGCLAAELSRARRLAAKRPPTPCCIDGCEKDTSKGGNGMCGKHAQRVRRYGDPNYITPDDVKRLRMHEVHSARKPTSKKSYKKFLGRHEHRVVMEQHIGRPLGSDELVHHIDGDKHNNAIENLQIVTAEEHARLHKDDLLFYGRLYRRSAA